MSGWGSTSQNANPTTGLGGDYPTVLQYGLLNYVDGATCQAQLADSTYSKVVTDTMIWWVERFLMCACLLACMSAPVCKRMWVCMCASGHACMHAYVCVVCIACVHVIIRVFTIRQAHKSHAPEGFFMPAPLLQGPTLH